MGSVTINVNDNSGRSLADLQAKVYRCATDNPKGEMNDILNYLEGIVSGSPGKVDVSVSGSGLTAATALVTFAAVAAADTITINGVVFTAVNAAPGANQFLMTGTDAQDAAAAAAAINASVSAGATGVYVATSAGAVLTVRANLKGVSGNAISIASSNGVRLAVSGTSTRSGVDYLSGGTGSDQATAPNVYVYGAA